MASDYGLNFGFRRSDEVNATREGRLKTPVASTLKLGTAVEQDGAVPGYMKACAANAAPVTGLHGLLVQEDSHIFSVYDFRASGRDSFDLGVAKANKLSVMWGGPSKVWFQNTAGSTRADGRVIAAVTIVDLTGVVLGDKLGWDGTKWVKVTGAITQQWMAVTNVVVAAGYVEAVLSF